MKMKKRSHRQGINKLRPRDGHNVSENDDAYVN